MNDKEIFNRIFPTACRYMRADVFRIEDEFAQNAFEIFKSLKEDVRFKGQHEFIKTADLFNIEPELTSKSEDLNFYLKDCEEAIIMATTLGVNVDAHSKKLQATDMSTAVVYDSLASAYLELLTDEYEESLNLGEHTFRFAPGYGDIPIELNYIIIDAIGVSKKIGIYKASNNLMLPQKSMITICGLGKKSVPSCNNCVRLKVCNLRKENLRCYY